MRGQLKDGRQFKIWFRHYTDRAYQRGTEAGILITNLDSEYVSSQTTIIGVARLNPIDTFLKESGRQLSLERAVENSGLSEDDKDRIWDAYNTRGKV